MTSTAALAGACSPSAPARRCQRRPGRCWLCRDDKREPMWGGALVHVQVVYAYAAEFGHAIVAKRE